MGQSQIFLIGFMASGKSTVGPLLARKLDRPFIDLDPLIESKAGCTIGELIAGKGEDEFRQIETDTLKEVADGEPSVIAPGGGVITRVENRESMSRSGITIWLDAPFELCWRRIKADRAVRPLAPDEATARERYKQRLAFYQQAELKIPVEYYQMPDEIAEAIIDLLRKKDLKFEI